MKIIVFALIIACFCISCTAPRVINVSGKVTPKGNVVAGVSYTANLPTRTSTLLGEVVTGNLKDIARKDTVTFDATIERINKAAIAFAADPLGSGADFYLRYGIAKRVETGYKLAGIAQVFSTQYQFMGPTGGIGTKEKQRWYGSAGLQYSWQSFKLPNVLSDVQSVLGYSFKRKDILVPVIFSYSFGNEEEYGSVAFGMAYSYSYINYATLPQHLYNDKSLPVTATKNHRGFSALGWFINVKAGYKYVYVIPALAIYYQNYGTYKLINGSDFGFKGFTFIPSVSLQVRLGK